MIKWFYSTDARDIGILYLYLSGISGMLGTMMSFIIRLQLMDINQSSVLNLPNQVYNNVITVHALLMIFYLIMPALFGAFGNLFLPNLIGAADMAFPRLNNVSFWLLFSSLVLAVSSMIIGEGIGTGWTIEISCFKILLHAWTFSKELSLTNITTQIINLTFFLGALLIGFYLTLYMSNQKGCKNFINRGRMSQVEKPSETELYLTRGLKYDPKCKRLNINWWLVGFTDGDGSFNVYINKQNKKSLNQEHSRANWNITESCQFPKIRKHKQKGENLSTYCIGSYQPSCRDATFLQSLNIFQGP